MCLDTEPFSHTYLCVRFYIFSLVKRTVCAEWFNIQCDKYAMIIYLSCNKLFDATPTFAAFIDSPSRHRETGHVIFIKLADFLGRESVNRGRSFSHIIFRLPVAFLYAKRKKKNTQRKPSR